MELMTLSALKKALKKADWVFVPVRFGNTNDDWVKISKKEALTFIEVRGLDADSTPEGFGLSSFGSFEYDPFWSADILCLGLK